MTAPTAKIHIGKHKTGTTSFQAYLSESAAALETQGVLFVPMSTAQFMAAALIREEMPIPPVKTALKAGLTLSKAAVLTRMKEAISEKRFDTLILSCEHLSYFREQSEIDALKDVLLEAAGIDAKNTSITLMEREPDSFLKSYERQIVKTGHGSSDDPSSPYYCQAGSWLVDDAAIRALWQSNFPQVTVLKYEDGDAVIQLCSAMDLPAPVSTNTYRENEGDSALMFWLRQNLSPRWKNRLRRLARSLKSK